MKYSVALSGSYHGKHVEDLFKDLPMEGILQMSLIGREITMHVTSENLEKVKKDLCKAGISNIAVLEWRKSGLTLSDPGLGMDDAKTMKVSIIPSVKGEGVKQLAFLSEYEVDAKTIDAISKKIEEILENAGVTEALYTVHIMEKPANDDYIAPASVATLNALFDSGGIVNLE
jgi:hypothetical protein